MTVQNDSVAVPRLRTERAQSEKTRRALGGVRYVGWRRPRLLGVRLSLVRGQPERGGAAYDGGTYCDYE